MDLTSTTLVGVWSVGPVLSSNARNLTEPVNGTRSILNDLMSNTASQRIQKHELTTDRLHLIQGTIVQIDK
jgi:hypothetical protein